MHALIGHTRHLLLALTVLALSAGLAFASTPPAAGPGLANAASDTGNAVDGDEILGEDDEAGEDEDSDEDVDEDADEDEDSEVEDEDSEDEDEDSEDEDEAADEGAGADGEGAGGEHCATDPSVATEEALALLNHGSLACWAAHQAEWPEWFSNHGAFVRCWAHHGKADAASCTVDPNAETETEVAPAAATATKGAHGKGQGKGHGKAKGKAKHGA